MYTSLPSPCKVDSLPSIRSLYEALVANGYNTSTTSGPSQGKQQRQAPAAAAGGTSGVSSRDQEAAAMRIQAVKLILQTVVAVCRYCQQVSAAHSGDLHWPMLGSCCQENSNDANALQRGVELV